MTTTTDEDEVWWDIPTSTLQEMMRRAQAGEDIDLILLEFTANLGEVEDEF